MKSITALLLAFASCCAFADGVPVITAGPPIAANDAARLLSVTKQPEFVKLHPINLNKSAFGSNVVTVVIDGKEYRFVGAIQPNQPPAKWPAELGKMPNIAAWSGKEPGGGWMTLTKNLDTGRVGGTIELPPSRRFNIYTPGGSVVLVEWDANLASRPQAYAPPASGTSR